MNPLIGWRQKDGYRWMAAESAFRAKEEINITRQWVGTE